MASPFHIVVLVHPFENEKADYTELDGLSISLAASFLAGPA